MGHILTDVGEEYTVKTALDGVTLDIGVYNDATDNITDSEDLADITTEPSDGNYVRKSVGFTASDISGNWGIDSDTDVVFDMTDTTGTVDSYFVVANFTATDTGDAGATDHLVVTGQLSQSYDLSQLTELTLTSGGIGWTVN